MWKLLLDRMLRAMISRGRLVVELHDGTAREYGDGVGDPVRVRIRNVKTVRALALYPELALGEAYMSRDLTIADDDVDGLLSLVIQNLEDLQRMKWHRSVRQGQRREAGQRNLDAQERRPPDRAQAQQPGGIDGGRLADRWHVVPAGSNAVVRSPTGPAFPTRPGRPAKA